MKFNYKWLLLLPVLLVAVGLGILIPRLMDNDGEDLAIVNEAGLSAEAEARVDDLLEQIGNYEKLLQSSPDDVEVILSLADAYSDLGKIEAEYEKMNDSFTHFKAAVDNYRRVQQLSPDDKEIYLKLALAYDGLLMTDVAYRELASYTPDDLAAAQVGDASLLIDAGLLYQEEYGRSAEAISLLQRATSLQPEDQRAWLSLGFIFRSAGMNDEASVAFNQVIALGPDSDYAQSAREYLGQT